MPKGVRPIFAERILAGIILLHGQTDNYLSPIYAKINLLGCCVDILQCKSSLASAACRQAVIQARRKRSDYIIEITAKFPATRPPWSGFSFTVKSFHGRKRLWQCPAEPVA